MTKEQMKIINDMETVCIAGFGIDAWERFTIQEKHDAIMFFAKFTIDLLDEMEKAC